MGLRVWLIFALAMLFFVVIFGQIIYHVQMRQATEEFERAHGAVLAHGGQPDGPNKWAEHSVFAIKHDEIHLLPQKGQKPDKETKEALEDELEELWEEGLLNEQTSFYGFKNWHTNYLVSYLASEGKEDQHQVLFLVSSQKAHPNGVFLPLLSLLMVMLLVGFIVTAVMANHIVKPLRELERYSVGIAHKRWRAPLPVKSVDEVGRLVKAMNEMQVLLKQSEDEQRAFLQSISHDLKTPITVILGHAQAIVDGVYIESVEHTAEIIKDEALRLDNKVKKILYYNTLDYSLEADNFLEPIDLLELAKDLVVKFKPIAPELLWSVTGETATVLGDYENLQVALENILDNALRYAQSMVAIDVAVWGDGVKVEIFNDGDLIPEEAIRGIFDQLAKGKKGNFGLGLFISKKIISHYNGEIWAENRDNGVCFVITLGGKSNEEG